MLDHKPDDTTAERIVMQCVESLDTMQGRVERGEKLLSTAHELLLDYCYTNLTGRADEQIQLPKEIAIAKELIELVISDIQYECDVLNQNKDDLERAVNKLGC